MIAGRDSMAVLGDEHALGSYALVLDVGSRCKVHATLIVGNYMVNADITPM
jgi:hypothetical protein